MFKDNQLTLYDAILNLYQNSAYSCVSVPTGHVFIEIIYPGFYSLQILSQVERHGMAPQVKTFRQSYVQKINTFAFNDLWYTQFDA
jgi:hypothetical protein